MKLFDFDGTLVDSNGVWVEVDNTFLARRGLTATRKYSETVGHSIFPIAAQFTKDYYHLDETPEAIMAEWLDMARDAYAHQVPLKPGAGEFLARRAVEGADMALVDLPWADEVWYGQWTEGELYVLVVRVGRQVTRLSSWEPLMTEEALAAIEARVTR